MHLPHLIPFDKTPVVFVTACTRQRQPLLANPTAHAALRQLWEKSAALNGWFVGQYLLMPDHVHFFASPRREACSLADWVRIWKSISASMINRNTAHRGSVWQPDYFDRYLRSLDDYQQKWDYVAFNPVRKSLVSNPEDWPYRGVIHDLRLRKRG